MGNNASESLKLAIGLVITMIFIAIVVVAFSFGRTQANNAISDVSKDTQALADSRYTQYDGLQTTGANVINVIEKMSGDNIAVVVNNTGAASPFTPAAGTAPSGDVFILTAIGGTRKSKADQQADLRLAKQPGTHTAPGYINPSGTYYGYVAYDAAGNINALAFQALQ